VRPVSSLAYTRSGSGEPLVLLHGLGLSRQSWNPVIALLEESFDVIAIDLPGFGESAPLSPDAEPHPAAIAAVVAMTLSSLDIDLPHVVGNSLGGWVALELAALTPVSSITLLSPAGLWRERTPRYNRVSLTMVRALARFGRPVLHRLVGNGLARWVIFRQFVGRPVQLSPAQARQAISDLATAPGFRATLRATLRRAYLGGAPIEVPVCVSFGTRDLVLLPHQSRHLDQLPSHTRLLSLAGTGHVPMTDDPLAVASLIAHTAHPDTGLHAFDGSRSSPATPSSHSPSTP
jgi:pimeloyl-ACP methyl ester carboxylesterase